MNQFAKDRPAAFGGLLVLGIRKSVLALCLLCLPVASLFADSGCAICGAPFGSEVYFLTDKVTDVKKQVCYNCTMLSQRCFTCGLPVHGDFTRIGDGRFMCERDAKNAVLEDEHAKRIYQQTTDELGRLLSRFLTLPDTNVAMQLIDRPHLEQVFITIGHDYECPNVLGCMETRTHHARLEHRMQVLSGLPISGFKATCAHELSHGWLNENLPEKRKETLHHDAVEAFCELVSYMLMELNQDETQKKTILANAYTRGQIQLFIEARDRYGLQDVIDWMKTGTDSLLDANDPGRVRNVEASAPPSPPAPAAALIATPSAEAPNELVLRGIFWGNKRPLALINNHSFELNEEARVNIGKTNTVVRCLEIKADSVRIRFSESGQEQVLGLKNR